MAMRYQIFVDFSNLKIYYITISPREETKPELEKLASTEALSRSEIMKKALQDYLLIRKFRLFRNKMMTKAQAQGIFTSVSNSLCIKIRKGW